MPLAISLTNILDLQGGLIGLPCPQCLCVSLTILEVAYSAAHFGSLLWVDHCFGCQFAVALIPSWSLQITALVVDFANLGQGSFQVADKYPHWSFFSVWVLVDGHLQGWFLLTSCHGSSLLQLVFLQDLSTNLWWHQFPSSFIGHGFKVIAYFLY